MSHVASRARPAAMRPAVTSEEPPPSCISKDPRAEVSRTNDATSSLRSTFVTRHGDAHRECVAVRALAWIWLVVLLSACDGPAAPTPLRVVRLSLNGPAGGQQAGFVFARKLGFYAEEGLDVVMEEARGSRDAAQRVADSGSDFAFADAVAIWQLRAAGAPLSLVSTIFQDSGDEILSVRRAPITRPAELRGATIGATSGTIARILLDEVLDLNQLGPPTVTIVDTGPADLVSALRLRHVSAVAGRRDFHSLVLRDQGEDVVELPYHALGVSVAGLSLAASDKLILRDPQVVERFVSASLRGWDAARKNPRPAGRAVVEQFLAGYEEDVVNQLSADLPLLCGPHNYRVGMPPSQGELRATLDLLVRRGLISATGPTLAGYSTDGFIPADAPTC
jgi:NitT/TauT family transport system substrate-binding protein